MSRLSGRVAPIDSFHDASPGLGDKTGDDTKLVGSGAAQYNPISALQVKLRTSKNFKTIVGYTTLLVVLVDILGTALTMPILGPLCAYAEGGPVDQLRALPPDEFQAQVKELIHPDAFKDPKPPFKFSLAMNVVLSFGQLGSALGSLFFGLLSDKIGCKIPMQICVFNGIIGYLIIYIGGHVASSYYLFALGVFWNNFFGNTMGIAVVYIRTVFEDGPEQEAFAGGVLGLALIGAAVGALIVMPFVTSPKNGENFFNAIWLAVGMTVATFLILTFILVPTPKPTREEIQKKKDLEAEGTPVFAKRILVIAIIASALDSAGDEGTRMARGTILPNLFPDWSTTERQNYLLLGLIFILIFALIMLTMMRKVLNLASICVIGCLATLATQVVLILEWDAAPFLIFWHAGKLFGFLSTLASSFIMQEISPKNLMGRWTGRNDALTNLAAGIAPLIFAPIYDEVGNKRGQEMLAATAAVSLLATIAYMPLVGMMPKEKKKEKVEEELKDLIEYEQMSDLEFSQLSMEMLDKVTYKAIAEGKAPRIVNWGSYKAERPLLLNMSERARKDFEYYNELMIQMLTSRDRMLEEQQNFKKMEELMPPVDREQAKEEMGAWIANYFDDAGYLYWETQCSIYKTMLMNAFPPIDALDDEKPDYSSMPLDQWEDNILKFLEIMNNHIATHKRRAPPISAGNFINVMRRR